MKKITKTLAEQMIAAQDERKQKVGCSGRPLFNVLYDRKDGSPIRKMVAEKVTEWTTAGGAKIVQLRMERLDTHEVKVYEMNANNISLSPVWE